MKDYINHYF